MSETARQDDLRPEAVLLVVGASVILGFGTVVADLDVASVLIALAALILAAALLLPLPTGFLGVHAGSLPTVLTLGLVAQLAYWVTNPPIQHPAYRIGWLAVGIAAIWLLRSKRHRSRAALAFVVAAHFLLMVIALTVVPAPPMDVIQFQQEGSEALLNGQNPYSLRFLNIHGPGTPFYAPEVIDGDRVTFGFPYPPVSLLMAIPGYVIAGDYRYSAAAAIAVTTLLIAMTRPGRLATGAAFMFMLSPPVWRVLHNGWSEAFVVPLVALTAYGALRNGWGTAISLGLLATLKQYLLPVMLIGLVLLRRTRMELGPARMLVASMGIAAATVLPFLLWDPGSFLYSTVTFHNLQPFRMDGLSLTALAARAGLPEVGAWVGFVAGGAMLVLVILRAPRSPGGFALGTALVLMAFFLFGKQAFANYYLVVLCALAAAIASASSPARDAGQ